MSLTTERMGAWQSIERALGYGAAVLEGGLGFLQFFWDPNRMCAQDRLAETIVVDVRSHRSVIHSHKKDVPALNPLQQTGPELSQKNALFGQLVLKIVGVLTIRDLDIERP